MRNPARSVLNNPTEFNHIDNVPFDVEQSHGVDAEFPDFGIGDVSTLYEDKDYNTGVNAPHRPITHTYLVNSARFGANAYHHEALCFIHRIPLQNPNNPSGPA